MKKIIASLACFAVCALSFCETIAWKGMEFGVDQNPQWLVSLVSGRSEKPARKKFGIARNASIFFGTGTASDLESARNIASTDCMQKVIGKTGAQAVNGLSPVYEYWEQDDEKGYTVTAVFSLEKR